MKNLIGGRGQDLTLEYLSKKYAVPIGDVNKQFEIGKHIEREHTDEDEIAGQIAIDHLAERLMYYTDPMPQNWARKELKKEGMKKSDIKKAADLLGINIAISERDILIEKGELEIKEIEDLQGNTRKVSIFNALNKGEEAMGSSDASMGTPKNSRAMRPLYKSEAEQEEAMKHPDKLGAGAKKRGKLKEKKDKVAVVMKEFARGTLRSGSGDKVTDRKQAIAIAISEAKKHKNG
jgi:hypothetical protein